VSHFGAQQASGLFSLFFPPNYQLSTPHAPRKSWIADGLTNEKTAWRWLFFRGVPLFFAER
jgi:hypothetical protein